MFRVNEGPWINEIPDRKELERQNIPTLILIAKPIRGFKGILIDFLMKQKKLR